MNKQGENNVEHLPQNPSAAELNEIGKAIIASLNTSQDNDILALIENLKSSKFKPFMSQHYIADWYLKKDGKTLYCGRLVSDFVRLQYEIRLSKINGVWKSTGPVLKMVIHRKK